MAVYCMIIYRIINTILETIFIIEIRKDWQRMKSLAKDAMSLRVIDRIVNLISIWKSKNISI